MLDLVGIFVFAISGALVGVRRGLDVFGVLVLAGVTGLGGGFLRDVLIGDIPPAALSDWRYLMVPVAAGLITFVFHPAVGRVERLVTIFDAFGLALFCVSSSSRYDRPTAACSGPPGRSTISLLTVPCTCHRRDTEYSLDVGAM